MPLDNTRIEKAHSAATRVAQGAADAYKAVQRISDPNTPNPRLEGILTAIAGVGETAAGTAAILASDGAATLLGGGAAVVTGIADIKDGVEQAITGISAAEAAANAAASAAGSASSSADSAAGAASASASDIAEIKQLAGETNTRTFVWEPFLLGSLPQVYGSWPAAMAGEGFTGNGLILSAAPNLTLVTATANAARVAAEAVLAICQGVGRYPLSSGGIASYETDVAAGLITGEGPVVRRNNNGVLEPVVNPLYFTVETNAGRVSLIEVLADMLGLLNLYPRG